MLKSIGSNWARMFTSIVVAFVLTPFLVKRLGFAANDAWLQIHSWLQFLSLLALGVPMTSVKHFAEHVAKKDLPGLNRALATTIGLYVRLGLAAGALGLVFFWAFVHSFELKPELQTESYVAFGLMILHVALGFVLQVPYGLMVARQDFGLSNLCMIGGMVFRLGLSIAVVSTKTSLILLAVAHLVHLVAEGAVAFVLAKRRYPEVRFGFAGFDPGLVKRMIGFSIFVLILQLGNRLAFQVGTVIVGSRLPGEGPSTVYSNGNQFMLYLTEMIIGIGQVVMPMAVRMKALNQIHGLKDVFLKWSRIALGLSLMVCVWLFAFGPAFIRWWIGKPEFDADAAGQVLRINCLGFILFLPVRGVALPTLLGLGKTKLASLSLFGMGVLCVALSLLLVDRLGLDGVALGTAVPIVLFAAAIAMIACRELGVPFLHWLRYVYLKPAIGLIPVAGLVYVLWRWMEVEGFWKLLLSGVLTVGGFAAVWVLFVHRGDPHVDLYARIKARLARTPPPSGASS